MKKQTLILFITFFTVFSSYAQGGNEKIEAIKIAFITKRLQLTTDEAKTFWPIYNQYEAEKRQVRESTLDKIQDTKTDGDFSNADAEQAITKYIEFKAKDLDLTKKYVAEFRKIIPATKIAKLVTAEEHFKKMLAKQAQKGGQKEGPDGPEPGDGPRPWQRGQ
ncbi:MAG: hypothetical protein R2739_03590 [Chitinophagales bacterium]|nr:hypothetical protein [Bacteroidota bacterium]